MSDNGGPAFPVSKHPEQQFPYAEGMTLRDWFAGQVISQIGVYVKMDESSGEYYIVNKTMQAQKAYEFADAMLEARKE